MSGSLFCAIGVKCVVIELTVAGRRKRDTRKEKGILELMLRKIIGRLRMVGL